MPSPDVLYKLPDGSVATISADSVMTVIERAGSFAIIQTLDDEIQTASTYQEIADQLVSPQA